MSKCVVDQVAHQRLEQCAVAKNAPGIRRLQRYRSSILHRCRRAVRQHTFRNRTQFARCRTCDVTGFVRTGKLHQLRHEARHPVAGLDAVTQCRVPTSGSLVASATSACARNAATGVRNSWAACEVNRRSESSESRTRSRSPSSRSARLVNSTGIGPPASGRTSSGLRCASSSASRRNGRSERPTTHQIASPSTGSAMSCGTSAPRATRRAIRSRVAWSSATCTTTPCSASAAEYTRQRMSPSAASLKPLARPGERCRRGVR